MHLFNSWSLDGFRRWWKLQRWNLVGGSGLLEDVLLKAISVPSPLRNLLPIYHEVTSVLLSTLLPPFPKA